MSISDNLTRHLSSVSASERSMIKDQRPVVIWLTGLSAAGKSTIANGLERALLAQGKHTYLLDGDNVRLGLCKDLGFSDSDREENIRRISEVASLFVDAGLIVITAFISPFTKDRALARTVVGNERFIEVYVNATLEECERRDPKGLYSKARQGLIKNFTGIGSNYEPPLNPEIQVDTTNESIETAVTKIVHYLDERQL
ncbi:MULTISPECIES: adenylyl-sulfate kinase [Pseudomonas syringae group genomosp. 2]|uniref:Adenylyl-sulfate kinase n=4 Tax=Pseudomonas syringae group genomosp. 2 TaxID=251698 RepID=A0A3M2Z562_PSEAJ|nr:adenylyl-sulfate kinase [Pseudomonas amygdali]KPX71764.1 Adenylyl-sulfate kinase [Pseudomonas amygdali pv. lachrymans]QED83131.1 adenylyl-sulfate kinase [Pseudomonas amygdali pv. tabaci str. ATCC 11528]RML83452.1 Adenylyl-sulfate kinase [Pseudomonas amygdali pv. tabaci]RMR80619.1 Adenylylsulfate kinase [Pseudomonas amygdali pv. tabaci]RMW06169.1 Adenylylsulfate kinase [Pseudomonas amygdali pv. tabaci]